MSATTSAVQAPGNTVGFENLSTMHNAAKCIEEALTALEFNATKISLYKGCVTSTQVIKWVPTEITKLERQIVVCESVSASCEANRGKKRAGALFATALVASVIALAVLTGVVFAPHSAWVVLPVVASMIVNALVGMIFVTEISGEFNEGGAHAAVMFGCLFSLYYAICPYSYSEGRAAEDKSEHKKSIKHWEEQKEMGITFLSKKKKPEWEASYQEDLAKLKSNLSEQIQKLKAAVSFLDGAGKEGVQAKIETLEAAQTVLQEIATYLTTETESPPAAV